MIEVRSAQTILEQWLLCYTTYIINYIEPNTNTLRYYDDRGNSILDTKTSMYELYQDPEDGLFKQVRDYVTTRDIWEGRKRVCL